MTLRGNLDAPEATLDALMQSVICLGVSLILNWEARAYLNVHLI